MARAGLAPPAVPQPGDDAALVTRTSANALDGRLVLEDLDPVAEPSPKADAWAEVVAATVHPASDDQAKGARKDLTDRFAILPDSLFGFLAETATEIRARIRIDRDTGVVDSKRGGLWYEENLPAEAVLWGVYALTGSNMPRRDDDPEHPDRDALARALPNGGTLLQLGGKAGVGRGLVRFLTAEVPA
jgi:CRISPR-associated protein Cmr4